jgi:hypothetical protein
MDKNLRNLALVLLEQILKDKSTNPVEAMEGLLNTIRVSQNAKQKTRLFFISGAENNHMEEQEFDTREASFPTLSQIGLPITKHLWSCLLCEIVE